MPVIVADSVEHALAALAEHPDATLLAGGTDLMVEVNDGRRTPTQVIAVGRVAELTGIRVDGHAEGATIVIGAATTFARLERGPITELAPALAYAARTVGSPQIRNAATIGGNLATASPAGDSLPVLVALGATIEVAGANDRRQIPIVEFFTGPKRSALAPGELVVAVHVPVRRGPQDYLKVGVRNAMVIAVASLAIAVDLDARTVGVGLGSVGPTPLAAPDACARVAAVARPIDDHRGTAEYRRNAVRVMAGRALRRCAR